MIDWHSHILPGMDDGSHDLDESLAMLQLLKDQGVDTVIATPHFFANGESVEDFLERRREALSSLLREKKDDDVRVLCGAEVRYYPGISRMENLDKLVIDDTGLLLLEMPMSKWTDFTVRELTELASTRGVRLIMAHIERYLGFQDKKTVKRLLECGVLMQVNASFFERLATKKKALKLLEDGQIHLIGSDCHNVTTRPPKLDGAYALIRKRLGDRFVTHMTEYGYRMIGHHS